MMSSTFLIRGQFDLIWGFGFLRQGLSVYQADLIASYKVYACLKPIL